MIERLIYRASHDAPAYMAAALAFLFCGAVLLGFL
jgi:hypothetical protein